MPEAARLDDLADSLPPPVEAAGVGGDNVLADDNVNGGAPPESEPLPSTPSSDDLDAFDKFLAEYDQNTGVAAADPADFSPDELARLLGEDPDAAARQQHEQNFAAEQQRYADQQARSALDVAQRDRQVAELRGTVEQLQQTIAAEQFRQHQARAFQDFSRLTAQEQSKLSDIPDIADNHVETFLLAEAARDPELARAFEGRYYQPPGPVERARVASHIQQWGEGQAKLALTLPDRRARVLAQQNIESSMRQMWSAAFPDPATYRASAAKYVNKALERMHREARKPRLDPDATSDRFAVAQAVRGASAKSAPPEPPVNLGRLSSGEFARHTMEKYGF
jgi:ribosomal protein L22